MNKQEFTGGKETSILILPTQLVNIDFLNNLGVKHVYLCALDYYYGRLRFHKLKLALLRATMLKYQEELEAAGFKTTLVDSIKVTDLCVDPIDDVPRKMVMDAGIKIVDSPNFILTHEEAKQAPAPHDKFYVYQRNKLNILQNGDKPIGDKYSFDVENRKKFNNIENVKKADQEIKDLAKTNNESKALACKWVNEKYPNARCTADPENFVFPVDRKEANDALELAMTHLPNFGEFQDAVHPDIAFGYHSILSSSLNVGLLTPMQVVNRAIKEWKDKKVSLVSVEAFIRQIIGWREYVRSVYIKDANAHRAANYFGGKEKIPESWYNATTGISLVDSILKRVEKYAYAHHIERLMYLCAVLNMMGCEPNQIHDWFMEMVAIDAYDWVMVPNITMGTYRIGGMTKRPYFSSYTYVHNMSGENNENDRKIWNELYYNFLRKHEALHRNNYFTARQLRLIKK